MSYQYGGALGKYAPTYVERQADRDLQRFLQAGEYCYILNSRQMGKSSLKVRTIDRLRAQNAICVDIILVGGHDQNDATRFYYSIADRIASNLGLESELEILWDRYPQLSDVNRLEKFIDAIVLEQIDRKIVIFIDEIDTVISLDSFTDDFFRLIRSCSELRATSSKYQRLVFVLIGVATPADLTKDKQRTPFNIGQSIDLHGFKLTDDTSDNIAPLINGLANRNDPTATIKEILDWTGGQPFLTQKICQLVVDSSPSLTVEQIIKTNIIDNWKSQDSPQHLTTIEARIIPNGTNPTFAIEQKSKYLLEQYHQILLSSSGINYDRNQEQQELKLSGLVVERDGKLQVYNRIYKEVFNLEWVELHLGNICPYRKELSDWLENEKSGALLLNGNPLDRAIEWRESKKRRNPAAIIEGAVFLDRSEVQRTDWRLEKTRFDLENTKSSLEKTGRRIQIVKKTTQKLIYTAIALFALLVIIGYNLYTSKEINQLDLASSQIIAQYEFAPLQSLKNAIKNANRFLNLPPHLLFVEGQTTMPQLALQKVVDSIQEINELNTHQTGINSIFYYPDDKILAGGSNGTINLFYKLNKNKVLLTSFQLPSRAKVNSVDIGRNQNSNYFVSGDSKGMITLWNLYDNKKPIYTVLADERGVQNVRTTNDGKYIFSSGEKGDGILKKWEIKNNKIIPAPFGVSKNGKLPGHKDGVVSLNLNGNEDRIASAGKDEKAVIWDLNGNKIKSLTGHLGSVNSVYFCSKASSIENCEKYAYEIATGSSDGTVKLWDKDGKLLETINADLGEVRAVRFSPDGKLLATASSKSPTASNGSSIRIWNLEDSDPKIKDRQPKLITEFKGHQGGIESIRFKPNLKNQSKNLELASSGKQDSIIELASSGKQDSIIRFWRLPPILKQRASHKGRINSVRFDSDLHHFITAGLDGKIGWWSFDGKELDRLDYFPEQKGYFPKGERDLSPFTTVRIRPDSQPDKTVAVADDNGSVTLLRIVKDKIQKITTFDTRQGEINSMDWNYVPFDKKLDSYLLATTGVKDKNLKIWEIPKKIPDYQVEWIPKKIFEHDYKSSNLILRFSMDGNNLLLGGDRGKVILIKDIKNLPNKPNVKELHLKDKNSKDVESKVVVGFNPDSKSFTIFSHDEGEIWQSSMEPKLFNQNPSQTNQSGTENIAVTKSNHVATGGAGAALRLWNVDDGRQLADFRSYWGTINSVHFSQDDKYLLAGGDDGVPRIWRVDRKIEDLIKQGEDWLK